MRANHGHPKPYNVAWWGVGNEMYGDWQLGHVPVERYALRHNAFVAAMKAKAPRLKVVAVGSPGRWNDAVLPLCAGSLDLLSGRHYTERKLRLPFSAGDAASYEKQFPAYSDSVAAGVRGIVADFRARLGKGDAAVDRLRLAIDEWGLVRDWNSTPDGPGVGAFEHYYCLGDAVMLGRGLRESFRVTAFSGSQRKSVLSTERFYFFDLGVRNTAAELPLQAAAVLANPGPLFEQWVGIELWKRLKYLGHGKLHYLRTKAGAGVDFIVEREGVLTPIEVKWTERPALSDARHLLVFLREHPQTARQAYIVCRCDAPLALHEQVTALPWFYL